MDMSTEVLEQFRQTALNTRRENAYNKNLVKAKIDPTDDPIMGFIDYQARRHKVNLDQQRLKELANDYDEVRDLLDIGEVDDPSIDHLKLTNFFLQHRGIYRERSFKERIFPSKNDLQQFTRSLRTSIALRMAGAGVIGLVGFNYHQEMNNQLSHASEFTRNSMLQLGNLLPSPSTETPQKPAVQIVSGMGSVREKEGPEKIIATEPPNLVLTEVPSVKIGGSFNDIDSNSPLHWDKNTLYAFNSTLKGVTRYSGTDIGNLSKPEVVTFDKKIEGNRWIEATYPYNGKLYGWYHQEQFNYDLPKKDPNQPLTIPHIGALVSEDNGKTWKDLGFIMEAPQTAINKDTENKYFAGGFGDFSVIPDQKGEYFYFLTTSYDKNPSQQGIANARVKTADLNNPVGKISRWSNGKWQEPGADQFTPMFPSKYDLHSTKADFYWGPSVQWNDYLQMYVLVMNHGIDKNWSQESVYISFNTDISQPEGWSKPTRLKTEKAFNGWYPQLVGVEQLGTGTDKTGGRQVRLFERGESNYVIEFKKKDEQLKIHTYGIIDTPNPTFFKPGTNDKVAVPKGEQQVQVFRPAGNNRFLAQTSIGILEVPMNQLDVQGNLSWEKEVKPLTWLGFDSSNSKLIDKIPQIGAGVVRIALNQTDGELANDQTEWSQAIKKAKEKNLEILLVYNPTKTLPPAELSKKIDKVLSTVQGYNKVMISLGNEPDIQPFWENPNLNEYAQFVKQASAMVKQKRPDIQQVIAAASQKQNIQPLIQALKSSGVNLNDYIFSLHSYAGDIPYGTRDVQDRVKLLQQAAGSNVKFMFDELGSNDSEDSKSKVVPVMVETARKLGAQKVIVFKLDNHPFKIDPNNPEPQDKGLWGYIKPEGIFEKSVWPLVNLAWEQTK